MTSFSSYCFAVEFYLTRQVAGIIDGIKTRAVIIQRNSARARGLDGLTILYALAHVRFPVQPLVQSTNRISTFAPSLVSIFQ